jgi:hypothetical protein
MEEKSSGFLGGLIDQAFHGRGGLGTNALPVSQAILRKADAFLIGGGNRVVKADALDETTVATVAFVGHDNVEKRAGLGTTA